MAIKALAGCGKTYTLHKITSLPELSQSRILYLVFNKKNQVEAQELFKEHDNVTALTTNKFLGDVVREKLRLQYVRGWCSKLDLIVKATYTEAE